MLELLHLLQNHFWWVIIIVGLIFGFVGLVVVEDWSHLKLHPRKPPGWAQISASAVCIALGIVLLFFSDHLTPYPSVEGVWYYKVMKSDGQFRAVIYLTQYAPLG